MKIVTPTGLRELTGQALREILTRYTEIRLDIGCGDGAFPLRTAISNPSCCIIGMDTEWTKLVETAKRAARKKVGPNLIFVASGIETPPPELHGCATHGTLNYPWGSLLLGLVSPSPGTLTALAGLFAPGATIETFINYSVFTAPHQVEKLSLPTLTIDYIQTILAPAYLLAGLKIDTFRFYDGPAKYRTTWGSRLTKGSGRETLEMNIRRV